MKKSKKALIIALILILIGTAIAAVVFAVGGSEIILSKSEFSKTTTVITEKFSKVEIAEEGGDVLLLPSADEKCSVVSYDGELVSHSIKNADGVLKIERTDGRRWYEKILPARNDNGIILYLPAADIESVEITTSSGDIKVGAFNAKPDLLYCESSSGDIDLNAVTADYCLISTSSGDISADNSDISIMHAAATSGDMDFESICISLDIFANSSSGDIELENVTVERDLIVETTSGDIELENVTVNGKRNIKTSSGDVSYGN